LARPRRANAWYALNAIRNNLRFFARGKESSVVEILTLKPLGNARGIR